MYSSPYSSTPNPRGGISRRRCLIITGILCASLFFLYSLSSSSSHSFSPSKTQQQQNIDELAPDHDPQPPQQISPDAEGQLNIVDDDDDDDDNVDADDDRVAQEQEEAADQQQQEGQQGEGQSDPSRFDQTDPLAYRKHLEQNHAPHAYGKEHSPTSTFSHIYVLSLPHRTDRRERMSKVLGALGLEFEFVDATPSNSSFIKWIAERVHDVRQQKKQVIANALNVNQRYVGGMGVHSVWYDPSIHPKPITMTDIEASKNLLPLYKLNTKISYPSLKKSEYDDMDWVQYLNSLPTDSPNLDPRDPQLNITKHNWDIIEPMQTKQLRDAMIATWYSQLNVMRRMIKNNDESALILEDDVDIEWDFTRIWPNIERRLPKEGNGITEPWHIAFLGHCWGKELQKPAFLHPSLHRATEPRCLHGYALSKTGVRKLVRLLDDPWLAYQGAIDTAVPTLIGRRAISAFSIEPSIITQPKDNPSDNLAGSGSNWKGVLADSTINRILRDEGKIVPDNDIPGPEDFNNPALLAGYRLSPGGVAAERESRKTEASMVGLEGVKTRAKLRKSGAGRNKI